MTKVFETIKGFRDFTGKDAIKRQVIKELLVSTFKKYGFEPAETPIIEDEDFVRGENQNDEAVSDIYKLSDKGNRKLALRYELTFPLKRISKGKKLPYKRYQLGPVFRDEPSSANRFRQFTQCDVDIIGSTIKEEAEVLALATELLNNLSIDFTIYFNSRKLLNEILEEQEIAERYREKVIKEIDKLDKISKSEVAKNLEKYEAEKVLKVFSQPEEYYEKYGSYKEIKELMEWCRVYGINVEFLPSLARGLSYYNKSVFEIKTKKFRETITAGGSYLVGKAQATGISFGLERLAGLANIDGVNTEFIVISINEDKEAVKLAEKLRSKGKNVFVYYGKPSKALEYANSKSIKKAIFVGSEEVKKNKFFVKDMDSGKETTLKI